MKWLARNLLNILAVLCTMLLLVIILNVIKSIKDEKQYKRDIENLEIDVKRLRTANKSIGDIVKDLRTTRAEENAAANEKIAEMEENQKKELARIDKEHDEERARVENLPASEVVVETKVILIQKAKENVAIEIWERPGGILFSLDTAKTNLAALNDFSFVEKKRDQWKEDYFKAMDVIKDKDHTLALDEEIFIGLDDINFNLEGIIEKKDEKFDLSEKCNVQMYRKGIKHGAPIGGGIVLLLWLVFGR